MTTGKLLLLPNVLEESLPTDPVIPSSVGQAVHSLQGLIAESEKQARRYLRRFVSHEHMTKVPLALLNEHSTKNDLEALLEPMREGQTWGLISDAGLPCIADPGSDLVAAAHLNGIDVETFVGPCSIVLALQLSGFCGQRFAFHGYLPRDGYDLELKVKELEAHSKYGTQIWIEAPYRSSKMLEQLKTLLNPSTHLCVATNLTTPLQRIKSIPVSKWKNLTWALEKEPAIFLIYTPGQVQK